jgi:hypothetical protein
LGRFAVLHLILQALSHLFPGSLGTLLRELAAAVRAAGL